MVKFDPKFLPLILLFLFSCYPVKKMTNCKCGKESEIGISLNGIYVAKRFNGSLRKTYIFYENGYLFDGLYTDDISKLQIDLDNNNALLSHTKRFKKRWGCYSIKKGLIKTQTFYELNGGRFGVLNQEGIVLNDSTFVILNSLNKNNIALTDTFLLQPFNKPDSINWLKERICSQ